MLRRLGAREVGSGPRIHNTICVVFPGIPGESLVQALDVRGVCASSGAACASGSLEPSPVLVAMREPEPHGALRLSLGPLTEPREIARFGTILEEVLEGIRAAQSALD
jgi:cysteine desulfurase